MPDTVRPPADYGQVTLTGGRKLLQQLLSLIPAFLLSWSLAALLLPLLGFSTSLLFTPLLLLGFLLILMLCNYNMWTTLIGSVLLLGGVGAGFVALRRLASAAGQSLFPFLRDWLLLSAKPDLYPNLFMDMDSSSRSVLAASGRQIFSLLLLFLIAMLAYFLAGRFRHPVWVLLILTALSTTAIYLDQFAGLPWLTMGLVADLLLFLQSGHRGAHDRPRQKILRQRQLLLIGGLLSLLILLPVYFVLKDQLNQPEDSLYSREWFGTVDDFLDLLPESWTGSREFHAFSISSAGYYPLGDRLGGAVELNDNPVMTVSGQVKGGLLRGQISSNYTGSSWEYPSNIQTWRLNSPAYALLQSQVYEPSTSLLDKLKKSRYLTENDYEITMLTDGYQVLFPALTPDDITLPVIRQDLVYFATDGVVYSQNRLPEGTTYSVSSSYINPDRLLTALTDAGLTVSALPDSAKTDDNLAQNLVVPDSADYSEGGIVYDTARQAAGLTGDGSDDPDPLTQAINLRDYLQQMTYTLDASAPAADEDFVAYFLQQQQGYCVYFASAMTMMARSLGIPARYVEGYLASGLSSEDSTTTITNRQAHAWSELYFDGIGWVSFDATPGASQDGDSQNNEDSLTPTPTPTPTPESVTPTPTPTADPQQQNTPTPT
ncbi:MAG: transglutaminase-like domain-containing protein, partial [Oscillospiraceae bacterium]|nr:transglutaminase-like domain-containing protein [Oscillospiraceae bacterium]